MTKTHEINRKIQEHAQSMNNVTSKKKASKRLLPNLDVSTWSIDEVCAFLESHGHNDIVQKFKDAKISGAALLQLNDLCLEKIGIKSVGQQLEVMSTIRQLQSCQAKMPKTSKNKYKVFNDAVHGHIELHPLCVKIVDTPQFQRLRYIKQLGGCYFVFPGASHNRFEHCLGVSHLAGCLARELQSRQPELEITEEDILCVEIAGLCHDLGHGPFSHLFDGRFIKAVSPNSSWRHEDASQAMFDHMVESNNLEKQFEKFGLDEKDLIFIKEQIVGPIQFEPEEDWKYKGRAVEKSFLYEIVANKRNGIDVDKWDYFARDCHHLGIKCSFDHIRFMKFASVINVEGQLQICTRDKEVENVYDMFHTRYSLHQRAYQHKNNKIVEHMITEAMVKANDHLKIAGKNGEPVKMSEAIYDMEAYTKLNDTVFHQILYSQDPNMAEARTLLERIERRELYKWIGTTKYGEERLTNDDLHDISQEFLKFCKEVDPKVEFAADDFVVNMKNIDYGMKQDNPIDHVRFYSKDDPQKAIQVRKEEVSSMLPDRFFNQQVQVYSKSRDQETVRIAKRAFDKLCESVKSKSLNAGGLGMTPLKKSKLLFK